MGKKGKKAEKPKAKAGKAGKAGKALAAAKAKSQEVLGPDPGPAKVDDIAPATTVDLWFDPICPWTWLTSRWLLDVETVRPVKTCFHVMSRSMLTGGTESFGPARVAMAVGEQYGQEQLSAFYTAIGSRIHDQQQGPDRRTVDAALADVGLPPELAELAETDDHDDLLQASHHAGVDPVGEEVDTPVLHVNGLAFIGPVFSPPPRGEEAGRAFDGVVALTASPGFFELRRARPSSPGFD